MGFEVLPHEEAHINEIWDIRNIDEIRSDLVNFPGQLVRSLGLRFFPVQLP
jgi:hypothetical protein